MLVGREDERERLDGLLSDARAGRSGSVLFRGDPGVGKTALLDYAIQQADGFSVLHVSGVESEAELPYSGLHALVRPIAELIAVLPDLQARALRVALALEEGAPDPFVAGAGTLTLLAEAADRKPVLLAVDDAQWLDHASLEALLFAARRLEAERIAAVFTVREGEGGFDRHGLDEVVVATLDDASALALLQERWGVQLAPAVAQQLVTATGANPLALVEVTHLLTDDERLGRVPLPEALPVSDAIERSVRAKLAALPESTRDAVLLAAVDESASEFVPTEELLPAEQAGLLHVHAARVVFVHPLFRAAVYHSVSPDRRREAHRRLASRLTREGEEDLRAWHLAAAADGLDESAATALEAAADRAEARGGTAARARALDRAVELSEDETNRARRVAEAARAARVAGDRRGKELVEAILPQVEDPLVRADLVMELSNTTYWTESTVDVKTLEHEAENVVSLDPNRAAKLLGNALTYYSERELDVQEMSRIAAQIEALVPHLDDWWRPRSIGWIGITCLYRGDARAAVEWFRQMLDDPLAAATQAQTLVRLELYEEARRALEVSLEFGREAGQSLRIAWTQACFGMLERELDQLPQAIAASSEAITVAEEIEAYSVAATALLTSAEIAADQGRADECRHFATRADDVGVSLFDEHTKLYARLPLAKLALLDGRYAEVTELLQPVADRVAQAGFADPAVIPYAPELVEAYARLGQRDDARRELDRLTAQAVGTERRWALAAAARCEALLADDASFEEWFGEALERHGQSPSRMSEARTRLCYGERLRRSRRRRDAREQLRAAIATFDKLGATPWSARARTELEGTGERIPRRDPTAPERLTPQELQIALQVAEGKTNREVAAALFLSPKTVEHHLTPVYRKLGLHSRAELIRLFAQGVAELTLPA